MFSKTIPISEAIPGMRLMESVYVTNSSGVKMLVARKDSVLDASVIKSLSSRVKTIDIQTKTPPPGWVPPEEPAEPPPAPSAPAIIKERPKPEKIVPIKAVVNEKLKEEAVDSVKQLFGEVSPDGQMNKTTAYQCVNNLEGVVGDLLHVLEDDMTGLVHINDLKQYDEYTYHHSLSVSVLSIATGKELGLDSATLFRLGRCAMLHDLGKQMIPLDVINKNGKLTDEEFALVKNHATLGAESLKKNAIGDVELWNGMMFHHEKVNGFGYPKQLKGKDIPLFSKIISVTDVYDALTSYRSYRSPMLPTEAFEIILKDVNTAFDYEIVKAFLAKLELYPINTIVELSNGKLGIIIPGSTNKLRPYVRLWGSTDILVLERVTDVNITKILSPADLPEGYETE
ncbi:MAG: HD-GYP domain-containing protein [Defluviitaleaceae bacterium]|nr:HD-GYP domain-containing protein [Defluviitaleaceae bacterium]